MSRPVHDPAVQGGDRLRAVQAGLLLGWGPGAVSQLQARHIHTQIEYQY